MSSHKNSGEAVWELPRASEGQR